MPKRPAEESLVGDIAVSLCPVSGTPVATLTHPDGGSCQVAVYGARVLSWRPGRDREEERLLPCSALDGPARPEAGPPVGGLEPCNLGAIPKAAWTVETLKGRLEPGGPLTVSLFAEVDGAEGGASDVEGAVPAAAPLAARATFSLWPGRLTVALEVANAADEEEDELGGSGPAAAAVKVDLGRCGFRGHCCGAGEELPPRAAGGPAVAAAAELPAHEALLLGLGLRLHAEGFCSLAAAATGACAAGSVGFEALASERVVLGPGEAMSGHLTLEVL